MGKGIGPGILAIVLTAALMAGGGVAIFHWWMPVQTAVVVNVAVPVQRGAVAATAPSAVVLAPAANPQPADGTAITQELRSDDANVRNQAVGQIRALAGSDRRSLAVNWVKWAQPLVDRGLYKDAEQWSKMVILERPYDVNVVEAAQRGRVAAFIGEGDLAAAAIEAKRYYNVAALAATGEAVEFLDKAQETAAEAGAAAAVSISSSQRARLAGIPVASAEFDNAIAALEAHRDGRGQYSYNNFMGRGNLLLLSDRPADAGKCFGEACKLAGGNLRNLRMAVEGAARSMRASDGDLSRAAAFLASLAGNTAEAGASLREGDVPSLDELRLAAQGVIGNSQLTASVAPPAEEARTREEAARGNAPPVRIESGFEGSTPVYVANVSPTHLVVELLTQGYRDWFMFRVVGAKGRSVRIDVTGGYKTDEHWSLHEWSVDPVYTTATDLADPATYAAADSADAGKAVQIAWNGPALSATSGQKWHYIGDVWSDPYTLSFVHRFESDSEIVAMRVPCPPSFNQRYLAEVARNPAVKIVEVGKSAQGRELSLVQIGDGHSGKPCVVIYAGEHADEPDASWVAQGAIDFLLGDAPEAADLRKRFTFLIVPVLDPDGAAAGIHQGIIISFVAGRETAESIAYASFFQRWVSAGKRIDLVWDLHNVQSSEGPHLFCALMEGEGQRGEMAVELNRMLIANLTGTNLSGRPAPGERGWMPDRLGGWLTQSYGALTMAYEVNSQAPQRHLNLAEVKRLGEVIARTAGAFLSGGDGAALLADVNGVRKTRAARWAAKGLAGGGANAIVTEQDALRGGANTVVSGDPAVP